MPSTPTYIRKDAIQHFLKKSNIRHAHAEAYAEGFIEKCSVFGIHPVNRILKLLGQQDGDADPKAKKMQKLLPVVSDVGSVLYKLINSVGKL